MDDIIQTVKLEMALECEQGFTLSKVWSYVELAQHRLLQRNGMSSKSVTVDDALKRYLWPFILKLPGMMFINDGTVIYEATNGSAAQSDAANNFLALSASEAESRFPDLIMRASCKAINKEIFGREEGNEKLLRSTNSYKLIQEISRSREKGVTQVQLSKIFRLDPRSTFHFIKNIDGEGLLAKSATYDSGNTTNLWVLRRFASDRQDAMDKSSAHGSGNSMEPAPIPNEDSATLPVYQGIEDLRKRASDILEAAGSEYILEADLMGALKFDIWSKCHRKYFHRAIGDLAKSGFVEKVQIQLPNADLSGFRSEMYRPVAEPATNALDDDEPDVGEAPESSGAKKAKGKAKKPVKPRRTHEEDLAIHMQKERISRGLAVGHSYRRCVRFIKPYVEKGSVRTRLGAPRKLSTASPQPARPTQSLTTSDSATSASVAAALTPEAELVLADMAKFNSISDIYAEAKERGVPVNTIIRECVSLGMLRQESVFVCNTEQVVRCDQLVKSYVMANRDSPVMTSTLSKSLLNYSMDLRTFQRIVSSLADQKRLWTQDVHSLPDAARPSATTKVQIAIARDTDLAGPVVKTLIAHICDHRRLNKQGKKPAVRRITDIVPVVRTEGAEERDREFLLRKMDTDESRAQGVKNFSSRYALGRKYVDSNSAMQPQDSQGYAIVKRAKVSLVENTTEDGPLEDWDLVLKRLRHIPRRIGRAKNLYDYLANNLADNMDDTYVYENCAFRSSFLFHRLPLELFLQITGGIAYFQDLLPFIRYGICTRVDTRTRGAVEAQIVEAQNSESSSLESINKRLATPINMLPPIVSKVIDKRLENVRLHIHPLIYALYILQLLRPVDTARDIVSMPPPPDAKNAFSSVPVRSPKELEFGYQLIGKARVLNGDGYNLALDAYNDEVKHRLDLTTCYLDTNVYDMMDKDSSFSYWSDLQSTAMTEAKNLPSTHVLFGIGLPYYWIMDVSLDGRQTKVLHSHVDEKQFLTPLDDPNLLADAAKRAGTTLEEARRYFQHQNSEMAKRERKAKAY
ncbi:hypothetical protein GGI17_000432 [Coemansia sp. S146]|nr:hypothetical protein GGI17_000432 [Coemansia sp. S146]